MNRGRRSWLIAVADGATTFSDLRVLIPRPDLFGEVASVSTTWRTLGAIDDQTLERIATARAEARQNTWAEVMDPGFYVIDIDGTLVTSDCDFEQGAAATYKKGFGFYPMMSYLDATGVPLAGKLRPGTAGSGTAAVTSRPLPGWLMLSRRFEVMPSFPCAPVAFNRSAPSSM